MKLKTFLIILTGLFFASNSFSQIFLGGNVSFSHSTQQEETSASKTTSTEFQLNPSIGYYFQDNVVFGIGLGIGSSKSDFSKSTSFFPSIFNRYYFNLTEEFKFYLHTRTGIQWSKYEPDFGANEKTTYFVLGTSPGISYAITPKMSLGVSVGSLGFTSSKTIDSESKETLAKTSYFSLNANYLDFGLSFKL